MTFSGAKLLLFVGERLVVLLRDDRSDIPYPGYWDLPGGGREGNESPQACVLRETGEETGLLLRARDLVWSRRYTNPAGASWMFAAHLPEAFVDGLRLGDEGQALELMTASDYALHPRAIPKFVDRLRDYLTVHGSPKKAPR